MRQNISLIDHKSLLIQLIEPIQMEIIFCRISYRQNIEFSRIYSIVCWVFHWTFLWMLLFWYNAHQHLKFQWLYEISIEWNSLFNLMIQMTSLWCWSMFVADASKHWKALSFTSNRCSALRCFCYYMKLTKMFYFGLRMQNVYARCRQQFANNWTKSGKCVSTYTSHKFLFFLAIYAIHSTEKIMYSIGHILKCFWSIFTMHPSIQMLKAREGEITQFLFNEFIYPSICSLNSFGNTTYKTHRKAAWSWGRLWIHTFMFLLFYLFGIEGFVECFPFYILRN